MPIIYEHFLLQLELMQLLAFSLVGQVVLVWKFNILVL